MRNPLIHFVAQPIMVNDTDTIGRVSSVINIYR
jgi:hypothetical protein